jgi:SAM-dependent methyltransferase
MSLATGINGRESVTTLQANGKSASVLACPACQGALRSQGMTFLCTKCHQSYPVTEGILALAKRSTQLGEFSNDEMRDFLHAAEKTGWKVALQQEMSSKNRAVADLILDQRRSNFLEILPPAATDVAVDIGCGYGGISLQLARTYGQVFALDSGWERLAFLNIIRRQEEISNIHAIHHEDVTSLPFADNSVDLLVMVGVFEYLPLAYPHLSIEDVQHRVLREVCRILKPGGHFYMGTKNRYGWPYWRGAADHNRLRFGPVIPRIVANWLTQRIYNRPYRIVIDSYARYQNLLRKSGFAQARFYWPNPGYQYPNHFVPLGHSDRSSAKRTVSPSWKKHVISILGAFGMLKFIAPHFSIVARKA